MSIIQPKADLDLAMAIQMTCQSELIKSQISGYVTLDVVKSIKERCLQWIGRERKLTLILNTNPTLTLILNTNSKIDPPVEPFC